MTVPVCGAAAANTTIPATNPQRTTPRIRHSGFRTRLDEDVVHRFARRCKRDGGVTNQSAGPDWRGLSSMTG